MIARVIARSASFGLQTTGLDKLIDVADVRPSLAHEPNGWSFVLQLKWPLDQDPWLKRFYPPQHA
jgi:hypothetical protein